MKYRREAKNERYLTSPSFLWLSIFFVIPACIIVVCAFKPRTIYGGVGDGWSLESIYALADPNYYILMWRTLWLGGATTFICLLLGLPVGYQMALMKRGSQRLLIALLVLPFWSSLLIRIFAWKMLLHPEGTLKQLLVSLHIIDSETTLLYNFGAVLLVMVYTQLPFAVFPIYVAASKFNFQLFEAGMDLGANRTQVFRKIFIPGIRAGLFSATIMVFISSLGAYIIPELLGGVNSEMIGNKIAQRVFAERNLPLASSLSVALGLLILLPLLAITFVSSKTAENPVERRASIPPS